MYFVFSTSSQQGAVCTVGCTDGLHLSCTIVLPFFILSLITRHYYLIYLHLEIVFNVSLIYYKGM